MSLREDFENEVLLDKEPTFPDGQYLNDHYQMMWEAAQWANKRALQNAAQRTSAKKSLEALSSAMQADPDFAWTWHCNVAMAAIDAGAPHKEANVARSRFHAQSFWCGYIERSAAG